MMRGLLIVLGLSLTATLFADTVLIGTGATWKYLDNGSNQGTNWIASTYNDAAWASGAAELGYGDGGETTVISYGGVATNKYTTYYFRRQINVSSAGSFIDLRIRLRRDDGAIVYINGVEVRRDNMPAGSVTYQTFAISAVSSADESTYFETTIPAASLLTNGLNTVAVEIHQSGPDSSDVSFDLELTAITSSALIPLGATWKYLDDGTDQGTAWRATNFNDSSWSSGAAELGYGDGDETTVLGYGGNSANKYITYYFRKSFVVSNPASVPALFMQLVRDDGAVVYINGTEVWRVNMPAGTVTYLTEAPSAIGSADESAILEQLILSSGLLAAGSNVVAVEIHQSGPTSSDISFNFSLDGLAEVPQASVVRGPYLQMGTPTSVVVRWRTDFATNSFVQYGSAPGSLTSSVVSLSVTTEHEITLTGLSPQTTYAYAIGHGTNIIAGNDTNHVFTTSPPPGTRGPMRIWVLGDSGTADGNARNVRDAFHAWNTNGTPNLWLMLGDNAYNDGTDAEFQSAVFDMYPDTLRKSVLWLTLGNHDGHTADSVTQTGPYYDSFTLPKNAEAGGLASGTEAYYSFDYGNVHFICLESYETDRSTNGNMMTWMRNDIGATTQDWVIAFWHHPPYSKGSHNSDTETELVQMRQNALRDLEDAGVDLVLSGHSHAYERSYLIHGHYGVSGTFNASMKANGGSGREADDQVYDKTLTNGTVYVVAGSSGQVDIGSLNHPAMFVSLAELGSMAIDVNGDRLDAYFIGNTPTVKDTFTLRKNSPVVTLDTSVVGAGAITPSPGQYLSNAVVSLTATPSNFYSFAEWSGDVTGSVGSVMLTLDGNRVVTGRFVAITVTNGVPQWWLAQYGLGTNDADALDDQDVDDSPTWEEFIADTVPTSNASFFYIESMFSTNLIEVAIDSSTQRVYDVDWTPHPADGWQSLTSGVQGVGGFIYLPDDNPTDEIRHYRVRVRMP